MTSLPLRLFLLVSTSIVANTHAIAAITHVQDVGSASFASDASGSAGSFVIPVTSDVQAGDIVVLEIAFAGLSKAPSFQSPSDSKQNEWIVEGRFVSGLGTNLQTFDVIGEISSTLHAGDSITLSFSPLTTGEPYTALAAAQEFSGATITLDGQPSVDGGDGSTNTFDTSKFGDLVTTNADDVIYAYLAIESADVTGFDQTSSPQFNVASTAQGGGLTLIPLYSIETSVGSFNLAGSYTGSNAPFTVIMQAVKGSAVAAANANLSVTKSHVGNFQQGQNGASYSLRVANSGTATTSGAITVTDNLPTGLSFASGGGSGWSCAAAGQVVTCTSSAAIASGGNSAITVAVNVAIDAPATVVNQASVACLATCTTSGNPATDPTTITPLSTTAPITSIPTLTWTGMIALLSLVVLIGIRARNAGVVRGD
jgi:uncharacterized repeat protein (TIGR01451 family)